MLRISLLAAVVSFGALAVACGSDPPPATPIAPAQTATTPQGTAPVAPGYNQAGYQTPGYTPTIPSSSATPGQMSTPGPTALSCQSDAQCMTHHCNMQFQKCAFPCQSDADCVQGATCFVAGGPAAICMPKP